MRRISVILLTVFFITPLFSQSLVTPVTRDVKWYNIEEAEKLMKQSPRPLFIDAFTDWCGWCKKMDSETFTNNIIADLLNNKYYPVKFDAEGKEKIVFMGSTYINDGKYGNAHQLAVALLQGQMSYPTVVFMWKNAEEKFEIAPVPGFRQAKEMEVLLSYFADNTYKSKTWEEFQKTFIGKIK